MRSTVLSNYANVRNQILILFWKQFVYFIPYFYSQNQEHFIFYEMCILMTVITNTEQTWMSGLIKALKFSQLLVLDEIVQV